MSKGKFALGAVVGAVIGGVAAWFTSPKSGKENREDLKRKADELKGKASELRVEAEKKANEVKARAEGVRGDLEAQAKELRDRAENAVQGAKEGFNKKPSTKK